MLQSRISCEHYKPRERRTDLEVLDLNHPTSRDQSARLPNQNAQIDEDPERRNPRSRPPRDNDAESASSSSHGRTPSRYTRSGSVQTQQGGHYRVHRVVASPAVVATPTPATGGIDQSMLLQALKMLEQQPNPVLVPKPNGSWRTCVDFTDLNKACPKDSFPLPSIDQLVDATAGHALLSFMDAYSGYNQIPMYEPDQEHTSFITDRGLYCYKVMPFGLINTGATYQRLVNMMFADLIGKTMEVYIDDMLVKSQHAEDHITHLQAMFDILRRYKMRLNPLKCVFGVGSGKFLSFMVNQRGIEANPAKIRALVEMPSPTKPKEVQSLTGKVAALNRFISRSSDKCKEFFQTLKGNKRFQWDEKCEQAFQALKTHLGQPPVLSKPLPGEVLFIYLAVTEYAISSILVREDQGRQHPVYYVSKRLLDAETRYPQMEKLAFALIISSRKLRPYFQAHSIEVLTNFPLRQVLAKPEASGRLLKWAMELSQFDIRYKPRTAIKGQALADFILEFPSTEVAVVEGGNDIAVASKEVWTLYVDGASNNEGSGSGILLISPNNFKVHAALRFEFSASNNEAEYEALIAGLKLALEMKVEYLQAFSDSQIVVCQVSGEYLAKGGRLVKYLAIVREIMQKFKHVVVSRVPRTQNAHADALARLASTREAELLDVIPVDVLTHPTIDRETIMEIDDVQEITWMTPILAYLDKGLLPDDKIEARKLRQRAARYVIYDQSLYRRSFSQPLLKCISGEGCGYILREVHEGICGNHTGGNSLALKIMRQGYYWPTLRQDALAFAKRCGRCQRIATYTHQPPSNLHSITSP
ncbi:hypothetical protein CsatB_020559 [Cannabis sativa]